MGMKILITGATGLIGRALCLRLLRDGHQVTALVRSMKRGIDLLGAEVKILEAGVGLVAALDGQDGVVHLAGEPLAGRRWSAARRRRMVESRVDLAQALSDAMGASAARPRVFLSNSAVGYYGPQGDREVDETSGPGTGFLADLCQRWESAAQSAEAHGVRVACFRTGLVLEPDGGALRMMELPYRLGLGGVMGKGTQGLSWIHLDDLVDAMAQALTDDRYEGPINGVSPEPASQRGFHRALCDAMGRPGPWWIPGPALRLALGAASQVVLEGQRVVPSRLQDLGFTFRFPSLGSALDSFYGPDEGLQIDPLRGPISREHPYLARRRPRYQLQDNRLLPVSLDAVARWFTDPMNLGIITPSALSFHTLTETPISMEVGTVIDYALRLGPIPMGWRTVIEEWTPGSGFVDAQHRGPYRCWWHVHRFEEDGENVRVRDTVLYAPPLGPLGAPANALFVAPTLRRIFSFRARAMARRFGVVDRPQGAAPSS